MVLRHGQVVAEGWWAPYKAHFPHSLYSLSKSFTSAAIGLAVSEGRLSLDDKVISFFPDILRDGELSPYLQQMTIRHLLTMSTGHDKETLNIDGRQQSNWIGTFFQAEVVFEPGTRFVYNSGATYMLSVILQTVCGITLYEYLQPRLFKPLGFTGARWELCPDGYNTGGWGLSLTTEDIAKFGQLYLQRGIWQDSRLIPESWIDLSTSKQIESEEEENSHWGQGYGYQFWRCKDDAYRADGAFGQFCIVMPEEDAVVVTTCATQQTHLVLDAVWTHLRGAMGEEPVQEEAGTYERLKDTLQKLELTPPRYLFDSTLERRVTGLIYALEGGELPWSRIGFSFGEQTAELGLYLDSGDMETIRFGRGVWIRNLIALPGQEQQPAMASFTWEQEHSLLLTLRFAETPLCVTVNIEFADEGITMRQSNNLSSAEEVIVQKGKRENE
nr:serine hydrolase [Paenibacillus caui]